MFIIRLNKILFIVMLMFNNYDDCKVVKVVRFWFIYNICKLDWWYCDKFWCDEYMMKIF